MPFIGNYATDANGNYKIEIPILAGYEFDRRRESILWTFGSHGVYFKYPNIVFFTNTGSVAYAATLNGVYERAYWWYEYNPLQLTPRVITVIHDYNNQRIKIYGDNYLIESIDATQSVPLSNYAGTHPLTTNSGFNPDAFDGYLGTPTFTAGNTPPSVNPARTPAYRNFIFPNGYVGGSGNWAPADNIQTQYATFQIPSWPGGMANSYATGRAIDLKNVAGYPGSGTITQQVIDDTIWLQHLLANDWGWVYDVTAGSLQEFWENRNNPASIARQLIDWALLNPPASNQYEYVTSVEHANAIGALVPYDFHSIVYTDPLSIINDNRDIYGIQVTDLFGFTGDLNMRAVENGEALEWGNFVGAGQPLSTQLFSNFYNYVRSVSDQVYTSTQNTTYRIYDNRVYDAGGLQFSPYITCNGTPTSTPPFAHINGYGSIQQYVRYPYNWKNFVGNDNGLDFYLAGKWYEKSYGYYLNTPFTGMGWSDNIEDNVLCAQGLAIHVMLKVLGSIGFFASQFSVTPDPKSYFYQCFIAPYVQAAVSGYEYFLTGGVQLPGDMFIDTTAETKPSGLYWTGTKSVPCAAIKYGSDQYMIGFAYMLTSNFDDQPDTYTFDVTIDGINHTFTARHCGDIIIYNSTTGVYTSLTSHFETKHFQYWASGSIPDTTPPVWDQPYGIEDVTLACSDAAGLATALAFTPTATDADSPPASVALIGTTGSISCGSTYTRTWRATDAVGNHTGSAPDYDYVQVIQILNAVDSSAPVITNPAGSADVTLECDDAAGLALALAFFPTATDDFDPSPQLNVVSSTTTPGVGTILYTITRIWNYSDASGNISSNFTQVITVEDTTPPSWVTGAGTLDGAFVYTDAAGIAAALALVPSATDGCSGAVVNPVSDSGVGVVPYTRIRTWEAVDGVGNTSALFTQTIEVTVSGMALEIKYSDCTICTDELIIHETTGIYDALTNPGGYGAPNPSGVALGYAYLYVPDSDFQLSTSYIDITTQFSALGFPTDNWASSGTILPADVGLTEFPQGWYQLQLYFNTVGDDYYINVDMYNNCDAVVDMATYNEQITAQLLAGSCECNEIPTANCKITFEYLAVQSLWEQGEYAKAMVMLKLLQDTLDNLLNQSC